MNNLKISEIFYSIQGETSAVGIPSVFIRLSGCNLNCSWCDTKYSHEAGKCCSINEILEDIEQYNCKVAVVTGGEPLLQDNTIEFLKVLLQKNYKVFLETNGSIDISSVPKGIKIILDMKTPSSNETKKMFSENIALLKQEDELKFVIASKEDFSWSKKILEGIKNKNFEILFSPANGELKFNELKNWVMEEYPSGRIQANIHKVFNIR